MSPRSSNPFAPESERSHGVVLVRSCCDGHVCESWPSGAVPSDPSANPRTRCLWETLLAAIVTSRSDTYLFHRERIRELQDVLPRARIDDELLRAEQAVRNARLDCFDIVGRCWCGEQGGGSHIYGNMPVHSR